MLYISLGLVLSNSSTLDCGIVPNCGSIIENYIVLISFVMAGSELKTQQISQPAFARKREPSWALYVAFTSDIR
jgi:hypothetical protein